jgi:anti-sigma regulatory factor (Ser/Thr protein kinase)
MAIVQLSISALPVHVRTARLLATAVARRAGIPESTLDEVRLAVGEACSRAVESHQAQCPELPIRVELNDHPDAEHPRFEVTVCDFAPASGDPVPSATLESDPADGSTPPGGVSSLPADIGLAVISGLAEEASVQPTPQGTTIRMSWPVTASAEVNESERRIDELHL